MINIDVTTKNSVYNTLGAQAQWIQHRFGKRNYPDLDLKKDHVIDVIKNTSDTINFISTFGDPGCYDNINEILSLIQPGKVVFNSHLNFNNPELLDLLYQKQSYVVVPLYGLYELCDKLSLHSNWDQIIQNLEKLSHNACVEFYLFQHNIHQVEDIKNLSEKYNFKLLLKQGVAVHPEGFSSIVNEQGKWLYDAYPCDLTINNIKWPNLRQTSLGYNHLIQYVKPVTGNSILNSPKFYKTTNNYSYDNNTSISVTGHVLPSFTLYQIFSNALCNDWNLLATYIINQETMSNRADYLFLCAALQKILSFKNNNLNDRPFSDILADFADSNV